jgi:hypothetical protein
MLSRSRNHFPLGAKGQGLFSKGIWLRIPALAGLGVLVLTFCCLLAGCGSESAPGGSVKAKDAKATSSSGSMKPATNPQVITPLLTNNKGGSVPGEMGKATKEKVAPNVEGVHRVTRKNLEAKAQRNFESHDPEIFPGATIEELKAREAQEVPPDPRVVLETFGGKPQK